MPIAKKETAVYRRDAKLNHGLLTPAEREKLLEKPTKLNGVVVEASSKNHSRLGVRKFLKSQLHALLYAVLHTVFSIYIRIRQTYHGVKDRIFAILYYHHRTPELIQKDVKGLDRLPEHLSVILKLEDGGKGGAGLEAIVDEVAEISAWCSCVGIQTLSVYEKTGILKGYIPATHRAISRKLDSYLGPKQHSVSLRAPHMPSIESSTSTPSSDTTTVPIKNIKVLLLSAEDGRDSLVDLTKTLAEMSQRSKLSPKDISMELVDAELQESVMGEPDLLVLFSPSVELSGYPPWQMRLTEIYHVRDNQGVGYQVFLRALYNFANVQMRMGR
ncbi:nuclear undecaprenyl pyrophosphate synthase-like protein [Amylocarpus encephaloides]|uniref:ditrans,polycis-polyprenyl diphosphate synthase [(2E,6E)-farnesyldiphosphate specific] n=1 Tax=Amylocarpus encephaloides TaxID=45428 RepID=A0A9P7YDZ4_9HELO|nr:nuclear undecaprenyl pyrophosphate synthase-like protein [Amylocarpus encephaloides]